MKRSSIITWDQLRVGSSSSLVALVVLGVAIYKLGQAANLFAKRYELVAFLPDANGLREGGSVMVAGQLAGTVKKIEFLPVDADTTRNLAARSSPSTQKLQRADPRGLARPSCARSASSATRSSTSRPARRRYRVAPGRRHDHASCRRSTTSSHRARRRRGGRHGRRSRRTAHHHGGLVPGEGTMGQLLTNRALYDQLNGTLGRANAMLARFQNSNRPAVQTSASTSYTTTRSRTCT